MYSYYKELDKHGFWDLDFTNKHINLWFEQFIIEVVRKKAVQNREVLNKSVVIDRLITPLGVENEEEYEEIYTKNKFYLL